MLKESPFFKASFWVSMLVFGYVYLVASIYHKNQSCINPLSLMLQWAPSASGFGVSFGCLKTFSKGIWSTRAPNTKKFDSLRRSLDLQTGHSKHWKDRKSMTGRLRINLNPHHTSQFTTWVPTLPTLNPSDLFFLGGNQEETPAEVFF